MKLIAAFCSYMQMHQTMGKPVKYHNQTSQILICCRLQKNTDVKLKHDYGYCPSIYCDCVTSRQNEDVLLH